MYAGTYQRRRHVGQMIGGGPDGGIFKSKDGGKTWTKLTKGLPTHDVGRISLADRSEEAERRLREHQFRRCREGVLQVRRCRRDVREDRAGGRRRPGVLPGVLRRSVQGRHDLGGRYAAAVEPRRRQDVLARAEHGDAGHRRSGGQPQSERHAESVRPRRLPRRRVRSRPIAITSWSRATAACTRRTTRIISAMRRARTGGSSRTCPSRSSIACRSTTRCRSTTCAAARRTTSRSAVRRARCIRYGSRPTDWVYVSSGDGFQTRSDPEDPNIVYGQSQDGNITRNDLRTGATKGIRPRAGGPGGGDQDASSEPAGQDAVAAAPQGNAAQNP